MAIKGVKKCRMCKGENLTQFLDLGEQPLANSFLDKKALAEPEQKYPLRVLFCGTCNLIQLGDIVDPETLFRDYVYFSSGMPSSPYYTKYAKEIVNEFLKEPHDLVVEIGSNDGHLLSIIRDLSARILGVDPALNIARLANERRVETISDFFGKKLAEKILKEHGKAHAIIGNNVVAHIDDHHDLVEGVDTLLAPDGVFIFEAPYLLDMFKNLAFDSIYHEHLSYLAVRPLAALFEQFGMEIFDVKMTPSHGISLRVYACRKGAREKKPSVKEFLAREKEIGFGDAATYFDLARKIEAQKKEIVSLLTSLKKEGKRIAAYGAPARGNTLLNYFGIGPDTLEYATEELASKIGLYTPGMHIPVIDMAEARKNPPDYYLLLAWVYKDVILEKEKEFRKKGGKFIVPIGDAVII